MITLEKSDNINGIMVYGDDISPNTFYVIPNQPRFRVDEDGKPVFNFIKYKARPNQTEDKNGGAYCIFDVGFFPLPDQLAELKEKLTKKYQKELQGQEIKFGIPTYLDGTASMLLVEESGLIRKVFNKGKPSLVGKNVTSFNMQLNQTGAEIFEKGLQEGGGIVQIVYDLVIPARFGKISMTISYEAEQIYHFLQEIKNNGWGPQGLTNKINQAFQEKRIGRIEIDDTSAKNNMPAAIKEKIYSWALTILQNKMEKELEKITPVSSEERKRFEDQAKDDAVKNNVAYVGWYWHWYAIQPPQRKSELAEDIKRLSSFKVTYDEKSTIEWSIHPQGMLPAITKIRDKQNNLLKWADFSQEVTVSDFYKRVRAKVNVNADFVSLPIDSVIVNIEYPGEELWSFIFRDSDNPQQFIANYQNSYEYTYWFSVNYRGKSKSYQSEKLKNSGDLIINVGDLGLLAVDIVNNVRIFDENLSSLVFEFKYSNGITEVNSQFQFDAGTKDERVKIYEPIFTSSEKTYQYRQTYYLRGGTLQTPWQDGKQREIYLKSPFKASESKQFLGLGLSDLIQFIDLKLTYEDNENNYRFTSTLKLTDNESLQFRSVPVLQPGTGKFYYEGLIVYQKDTRLKPKKITRTEITEPLIEVGDIGAKKGQLKVLIYSAPNLWQQVGAVSLLLCYADEANKIFKEDQFDFQSPEKEVWDKLLLLDSWHVLTTNDGLKNYHWTATFVTRNGEALPASGANKGPLILKPPATN